MGLDYNGTRFLLYARKQGVSFHRTAMVGRQFLNINAFNLKKNLEAFDYKITENEVERILTEAEGYAEPFLKLLNAETIESFDASDYENATHVHDFNQPIPENFKNRFSVVLDGGTLEHIFNFPTAIKNCLEMVEEGGHFLSITPTNNFLGHGFYQYSPELFFRILNERNGYAMREMLIFEDFQGSQWYSVVDPEIVRERVILSNKKPTYLLVIAQKTATVPIFQQTPQQSDYFAAWQEQAGGGAVNGQPRTESLQLLKKIARPSLRIMRQLTGGLKSAELKSNSKYFKKIDLP
jgi:SAM-dependent methyltransferase